MLLRILEPSAVEVEPSLRGVESVAFALEFEPVLGPGVSRTNRRNCWLFIVGGTCKGSLSTSVSDGIKIMRLPPGSLLGFEKSWCSKELQVALKTIKSEI